MKIFVEFYRLVILITVGIILFGCEKKEEQIKIIDGPSTELLTPAEILITWETDLPGNSIVKYGLTSGLGSSYLDREERQIHNISLRNLNGDTTYFFKVQSQSSIAKTEVISGLNEFKTGVNEESIARTGWKFFDRDQYDVAQNYFEQALSINPVYGWAFVGLGWVKLRQDSLTSAISNFTTGLGYETSLLEGRVGRMAINLSLSNYDNVIDDGNYILRTNPEYSFEYDNNIDYRDVRIMLAHAYYAKEDFESAQAQCDILDPDNGLDPVLPSTWVVEGFCSTENPCESYYLALLKLINFFDTLY